MRSAPITGLSGWTILAVTTIALVGNLFGCNGSDGQEVGSGNSNSSTAGSRGPAGRDPNRIRNELRVKVELPDFYPDDAPIYPGSATNNVGRPRGRVTLVFSTNDSTDQVSQYVLEKLPALGWDAVWTEKMANASVIHAGKGEREISVLIASMDEGTEYELTMMVVAVDP